MSIVRELVTFLGFEIDDAALKKAKEEFEGLKDLAKGVVAAVAATTGALAALAIETADYADDVSKAAAALGISTGSLQRMEFAASTARVEASALRGALRDLQKNAYESTVGNADLAGTFWRLGIAVRGANGKIKSADDLFLEVNRKLAKVPDLGKRTAFALKLMGGEGTKLNTIFAKDAGAFERLSAQAEALGLVMDEASIKSGEEFARELSTARFELTALGRAIGAEVIPYGRQLLAWARLQVRGNRELVKSSAAGAVRLLVRALELGSEVVRRFGPPIMALVRGLGGLKGVAQLAGGALTVALVVKLGRVIQSLEKATKAGKGVLTMVRMLGLAPAFAAIKWLALAAVIGLVIDDVLTFGRGGKSVLGDLLTEFTKPINPDDTWPIKILKMTIGLIATASEKLAEFLGILKPQADFEGQTVTKFTPKIVRIRTARPGELPRGSRSEALGGSRPISGSAVFGMGFDDASTKGDGLRLQGPDGSDVAARNLGARERFRIRGNTTISAPVEVNVDASGSGSPDAVGEAVGSAVSTAVQDALRAELDRAGLSQDSVVR